MEKDRKRGMRRDLTSRIKANRREKIRLRRRRGWDRYWCRQYIDEWRSIMGWAFSCPDGPRCDWCRPVPRFRVKRQMASMDAEQRWGY